MSEATAKRWLNSAAAGRHYHEVVASVLKSAARHSKGEDDFQALAMTALTAVVFGTVGELADGDPDDMRVLLEAHNQVLVEALAKWQLEKKN